MNVSSYYSAACVSAYVQTESTLLRWVQQYQTHMIVTDSVRCPWWVGGGGVAGAAAVPAAVLGNSGAPAAGQDKIYKWPCPVHGVDAEHVFPPNLHAGTIAQAPSGAPLEICNICVASTNTALLVPKYKY